MNPTDNAGQHDNGDCVFALDHIESFALGALDSFDRGIVEHHLRWCESCRREAATFERVVELMHLSTPLGPPPSANIKQQLMKRLTSDDLAPPLDSHSHRVERSAEPAPSPRGWTRYIPAAVAAPLAIALLVVGAWANSLRIDLSDREQALDNQVELNGSLARGGQVRLFSVEQSCPDCEGNGHVGVSESNGMGMVVGQDFNPSQQHDVWGVNDKGEKKMFCKLEVDPTGVVMQMFTFPDAPSAFTDVYITDEHGAMIYVSGESIGTHESTPSEQQTPLPTT